MNLTDWSAYINKWGGIEPQPNTISDNSVRFTTEAILYFKSIGDDNSASILFSYIEKCQQEKGLMQRYPGCLTQDSFDNYISVCAASYLCDHGLLARSIYEYGKSHFGFYCNNGFAWNAFLFRNPSLVSFMRFCAFDTLSWLDETILTRSIKIAAESKEQDSKILSWMIIRCLDTSGKVVKFSKLDMAIAFWVDKLIEHYGSIGHVLGEYFGVVHYEHPNSKALMGVHI